MANPPDSTANAPKANIWHELTRGPGLVRLALVMTCVSLHAMDVFVTSTILPSVVADIDGVAFYAWPSALYIITSIMGAASGGMVGGNLGLRRALTLAACTYLLGAVFCALAPNMAVFLAGRTAQGLGAGLLVALSYSMVGQLFDEQIRPRVIALISAIWGLSALVGPLYAGAFAQMGFWRGVYWITFPIVVLMLVLARRALSNSGPSDEVRKLPWARLLLLGTAVLCVTVSGQIHDAALRAIMIIAAILGVGVMLYLDHIAKNRLLPTGPASLSHTVGTGYWMFFLMTLSFAPLSIFLPLLAQRLHGVEPLMAGYVSAVLSLGWSAGAIAAAGASPALQRVLIITGPACLLAGIAGQSLFVAAGPMAPLIALIFLSGLGIGQCHVHVSNRVMSSARPGEETLTASAIPTMQSLGIAFGAATGGLLANVAGLSDGITVATLTAVTEWIYGFALIPALATVLVGMRLIWFIKRAAPRS